MDSTITRRKLLGGTLASAFALAAVAACSSAAPVASPTSALATSAPVATAAPAATKPAAAASPAASPAASTTAATGAASPAAGTTPSAAASSPAAGASTTPATTPGAATTPAAGTTPSAQANPTAGTAGAGATVTIGAVFSMTQAGAVYGATQKNSAQLALNDVNTGKIIPGVTLNILFDDDASDKTQGINVFNKFINQDKVIAIIGPTLSNTAQATDAVSQKAGVPTLGVSNTAGGITELGDYIYRDSLTEAQVIPQTIKAVVTKLSLKKAAILYGNNDAFTKAGYDEFKKALQANNVQITSEQTFATGDKDFSAQLTAIKGTNPEALVVSALADEAASIMSQARRLGIDPKVPIVGGNGFNSPAVIKNAGQAAEGTIIGAAWNAASPNTMSLTFIKNYQAKYNSAPDQFAAQAYAGVQIMADALKRAGANADRAKLRDALAQVKNLDTVLGSFSFNSARDADHPAVIQIVKNGEFAVYS